MNSKSLAPIVLGLQARNASFIDNKRTCIADQTAQKCIFLFIAINYQKINKIEWKVKVAVSLGSSLGLKIVRVLKELKMTETKKCFFCY